MDPDFCLQGVIRCHICESPTPPMHCDICCIGLCKACVAEHLLDESKGHCVVLFKKRGSTANYPTCLEHPTKNCELFCEQCDIPICVHCVASQVHKGHDFLQHFETNMSKVKVIQKDLRELKKIIYPKYQEIAADIQFQKTEIYKNAQSLATDIEKLEQDWHRKLVNLTKKLTSDIEAMLCKDLLVLDEQENEVSRSISEIFHRILDLKRMLYSGDSTLVDAYVSRNSKFRKLPLIKITKSLPCFSAKEVDTEELAHRFGTLSASSTVVEEYGYVTLNNSEESPLLEEPKVTTKIDTGFGNGLHNVDVQNDGEIWTSGWDKILKLFNLNGELIKSVQTKSGNAPQDMTVTSNGDLVYTDDKDGTVNINLKNTNIEEMVWLPGWKPQGVCSAFSDHLLVIMVNDDFDQTKVVRYFGSTETQTIQFDDKGRALYSSSRLTHPKYITENGNRDICVSDCWAGAVIVVSQVGVLRFKYTGDLSTTKGSFDPHGIAADSQSRILISDFTNKRIHILDQDGRFLRYIENCNLRSPRGICVNTKDELFVAESADDGTVKKIKYTK